MNIDVKRYYGNIFRQTRLLRLFVFCMFVYLGILFIYVTHLLLTYNYFLDFPSTNTIYLNGGVALKEEI